MADTKNKVFGVRCGELIRFEARRKVVATKGTAARVAVEEETRVCCVPHGASRGLVDNAEECVEQERWRPETLRGGDHEPGEKGHGRVQQGVFHDDHEEAARMQYKEGRQRVNGWQNERDNGGAGVCLGGGIKGCVEVGGVGRCVKVCVWGAMGGGGWGVLAV